MITLKKRIISAFLTAVMLLGIIPAMPIFAEEEPTLLQTQKLDNVEYDENTSYTMMGTVQSEVDEKGRYILTVFRSGKTDIESTVDLKTADVSAKYGVDYVIDDDRYTTQTEKTSGTLLELSANEEKVKQGEKELAELQDMVDSSSDTEENTDEPVASEDMFLVQSDEEKNSDSSNFDLFANNFTDLETDKEAVSEAKDEGKSSLAKLKEEQTGLQTRQTYDTDMQPITQTVMNSMGVVDMASHIETSSTTPLSFAPGETEKQIIFKVIEDDESEGQEIINFMLSNPGENTELAEPTTTSIVINDDEPVVHSKVSFTAEEFDSKDGKATITVTRDKALYSYVTAKVKTVENGDAKEGKNYSATDTQIEFRPYQEETSFEIPVSAKKDMSFGIELYDLKGGEDGSVTEATVNIKPSKSSDEQIETFNSETIEINGKQYRLDKEGNKAKIMDDDKEPAVYVGDYYYPTPDNVKYGFSRGDTHNVANRYEESRKRGYLATYDWRLWSHGEAYATFDFPAKKYQTAWLDFSTDSDWEGSWHGFRIYQGNKPYRSLDFGDYHKNWRVSRAVRGPIKLLSSIGPDNKIPNTWYDSTMEIYARRNGNGCIEPTMYFYGIALMFREFHVYLEQPDAMEFKTPTGTTKQRPARVELGKGQDTVYMNQTLSINATATENGGTIKGTLKGYYITAGDGATPYFYPTNGSTLTFNQDLVGFIDRHTSRTSDSGAGGYFTKLYIKPVYDYIPVDVEILPSDSGKFKDANLQESSSGKLHIGDTLSTDAIPALDGYTYTSYDISAYKNPGDTKPISSGTMDKSSSEGKLELREVKYRLRPNFEDSFNYIEVQLDAEAEKYFEVVNTIPDDLIDDSLADKNVLYISGDPPYATPTAGKAYTVQLKEKEGCDGKYRPKITREYTGDYVNGWTMDFIAEPLHGNNIIKVTAEKVPEVDENNPDTYTHNVAMQCVTQYSSVSVRQSSDVLMNEPAIGASITSGTTLSDLYDNDGNLTKLPNRYSTESKSDGTAEILLTDVYYGDSVSVLVTNNDIDQVYYTKINSGTDAQVKEKTFQMLEADNNTNKNTYVEKKLNFEADQNAPQTINMPIRTPYSPYVVDVRYNSVKHPSMDTRNNSVELYEDDTLEFTAEINSNDTDIKRVEFIRYDKDGDKKQTYEATKKEKDLYTADISASDIFDGDKMYVRIVVDKIVLNERHQKVKVEQNYPTLNTGLSFYTPISDVIPQHMEMKSDVLGNLPIVGDIAPDLDTGKLKWQTVYDDPKNKATSARAEIVSVAISVDGAKEKAKKLKELKNGKTTKAQKSVADQLASFDPQKEASAQDLQQLKDSLDPNMTDEEKEAITNAWTDKQKQAKRKELEKEQLKTSTAELGEMEWDIQFTVILQFEYAYDYELNEHKFIGGQYLFGGAFNIKKTQYWIVYGVPVYLDMSGYVSIQFDGIYTTENNTTVLAKELKTEENLLSARIKSQYPWAQVGLGGKLQPGVGICGILGVRGIFKLDIILRALMDLSFKDDTAGAMITLSGGVGVDLLVFSFDYTIGSKKFGWGIYSTDSYALNAMADEANINIRPLNRGNETDTAFEKEPIEVMSSLEPTSKTTLVDGAMEYVRPKILRLNDGRLMMVYLKNDPSRDDSNAASLVYTIKDTNGVWSEPKYVDNDGTSDSMADIFCDGDKVYIAWVTADSKVTSHGDNFEEVKKDLEKLNIKMCTLDVNTNELSTVQTVTSDEYMNTDARISKEGDNIALYYLKKDISGVQDAEHLISTTSNYSTWAKKLYNPKTQSFVKQTSDGGKEVEEKLLYIKHPTISDPLVYDYGVERFVYDNGTDNTDDDVEFSLSLYSIDRDKNIDTNDDREVWLEITDVTAGKTYYPIKISSDSDNIINPKITEVSDDVLLTWLSDTSVFNTISMQDFFSAMKNQTGDVNGAETGTNAFDLFRSLTAEEAAKKDWASVLADKAKNTLSDSDKAKFDELFSSLSQMADGTISTTPKDFSDGNEEINMSDYQIVVGADENTYLFWTGASASPTNFGKELYGTAYYKLNDDWTETWGSDNMPNSGWGNPVQLTEYGEVIDEMAITVDKDKNAVIIANMFDQSIDEDGNVVNGVHKLSEIDCIPSNSLDIVDDEIKLSEEYPVAGETTTISFIVKNNGLLPSTGQDVEIRVLQDGNEIFKDTSPENDPKDMIFAGNEFEYSTEWTTPKNLDGDIKIVVDVKEHGTQQVHTATKVLEKKAKVEFGDSYSFDGYDMLSELCQYIDNEDETESDEAKVIRDYWSNSSEPAFDYMVFLPVTNSGNAAISNIKATATHINEDFKEDGVVGTSKSISLEPKETKLIGIPVTVNENSYTKDGIIELKLNVYSGETQLDSDILHQSIYETENTGIIINDNTKTKDLKENETFKLETKAYPFDSKKKLSYYSSDSDIAQVSEDGVVTAVGQGNATIFATDMVSGAVSSIDIKVDGVLPTPTPTSKPHHSSGSSSSKSTPTPSTTTAPTPSEVPQSPEPTTEPVQPTEKPSSENITSIFVDVDQNAWYRDSVQAIFEKNIMQGTDSNHFAPDTDVTRGMFAATLYRLEGEPETDIDYTFTDVPTDAYYAEAVSWATQNGIISGYSDEEYAPNDTITREQMAAMIYRYAQYKGKGFADSWMFKLDFDDSDDVSEYAYEAMCWNTTNEIINGVGDNKLSPKSNSTRAQVATVLVKLIDVLSK